MSKKHSTTIVKKIIKCGKRARVGLIGGIEVFFRFFISNTNEPIIAEIDIIWKSPKYDTTKFVDNPIKRVEDIKR